ncbi:HlyD family efflux transporter periplasmic adaptor subunit [Roseateles sp. DAIF2]|uniref:efflux RND transporter periplasmic adaptor subunit n=1 Tax=Roseateles sp. DAIF2 TaxID=2714952 RepID=UPI0018A2E1AA|nr:efflux RND transporter periplasmic adaptor subunit [Roseateles sp. DAIF2]QPF73916.1 HlyD family efflux transporter periplasmic adaptor subunit [Roseateles sp. DAIF2]
MNTANNNAEQGSKNNNPRKKALTLTAVAVLIALGAYGAYQALVASKVETTDNAYVQANVVQITPQVGGTVRAIHADDTDFVKAGQPLISLDPADAKVAYEQAQAQLAQTVREVRALYAGQSTLKAQITQREAEVARLQSELVRVQDDVKRRQPLLASGAIGREELEHAQAQVKAAQSALAAAQAAQVAARDQLATSQVQTDGTTLKEHPQVQRAGARLRETWLALQRAELPAPVDGWVARRSVQLGQRVNAGTPLMAVVGLKQAWVDANFKESQLAKLRIGQTAILVADVYGDKQEYHGRVAGLSAGTGAAFALLPAQNATGNWIKVVQRVPVRIELDAKELAEHPLRVGLSMEVKVDVQKQDGPALAAATSSRSLAQTAVFEQQEQRADEEVQRIIRANSGNGSGVLKS